MAITTLPTVPNRGMDPVTFTSAMDTFLAALPGFAASANVLAANLNSVAAGGAYAIPFQVAPQASVGGAGGGKLACENSAISLAAATMLYIDQFDSRGLSCRALLDEMYYAGNNLNTVRGYVKLTKVADPTQWITFRITNWAAFGSTYGTFSVTCTGYSAINPFAIGDSVVATFQRNGDKGDPTLAYTALFRDIQTQGTAGQALSAANWTRRNLNTTSWNDIPSASLAPVIANTFRLPAGKYVIRVSAPAYTSVASATLKHCLRLWNLTTGGQYDLGSPQLVVNGSAGYASNTAIMTTIINLSSSADLAIEHYASVAATGGFPMSNGNSEIYTEVLVMKVSQ